MLDKIRECIKEGKWAMTAHARARAGQRKIKDEEVVYALVNGEILENYPDDPRGPSALILGYTEDKRPLHVVCAFDPSGTLLIITVYEPQPPKWVDEKTRG
ncbi:protein of unknown function [Thermanaeromonas toyohensis ToBE]|uniref:DUF4258 domain-containing protein n=1 Tax=Thermanaeromonas toyohensis ToBE TaxID=698762 RepID=A0A1W1W0D8_9FIRM|nr:DUF4258 domain-containing protein [Thermanaeromonas toyohensis]SMB99058.1 protein of unknown function [Thermanaeromonas toyohensis ToBE]